MDKEEVDLFQSDFRVVADYFVQKQENGDYEPKPQDLKHVQETLQLLSVMTNDHRFEDVYNEASDAQKGEMRNMCEILDKIENRGRKTGSAAGKNLSAGKKQQFFQRNGGHAAAVPGSEKGTGGPV